MEQRSVWCLCWIVFKEIWFWEESSETLQDASVFLWVVAISSGQRVDIARHIVTKRLKIFANIWKQKFTMFYASVSSSNKSRGYRNLLDCLEICPKIPTVPN